MLETIQDLVTFFTSLWSLIIKSFFITIIYLFQKEHFALSNNKMVTEFVDVKRRGKRC